MLAAAHLDPGGAAATAIPSRQTRIGKEEGARLAYGGEALLRIHQAIIPATNRDQMFGPVAAIVPVRSYDEALATANDTAFGRRGSGAAIQAIRATFAESLAVPHTHHEAC